MSKHRPFMKQPERVTPSFPVDAVPIVSFRRMMNRRTFIAGSILTGCSLAGLFAGITTAMARRRNDLPMLPVSSTTPLPPLPSPKLQQALLFSGHQQTVRAVSWSPDGTMIASGADDGFLLLWTPDGQMQQKIPHLTGITALAWSPSGGRIASGTGRSVCFFDRHTGASLVPARNEHTAQITSIVWSQAPGKPLISGSVDTRAIIWETDTYQPQGVFTGHTTAIDALSCLSKSTTVASASQGGVVRVWDVGTLQEVHGFYQETQEPIQTLAFAPAGTEIAVGGNDGQVRLWLNGIVCQQSSLTTQGTICGDVPQRFHAQAAPVRSISWSPDGHSLATGGEDGTLTVWTGLQGQLPIRAIKTMSTEPVLTVAWSPQGGQIAVGSGKTVTIWNIHL